MDDDRKQFECCLSGVFQIPPQINFEGVLHKLADFAHIVGKALELESGDLGEGFQHEALPGVGAHFAMFAEIPVAALQPVHCEEAADPIAEGVGPLALLTLYLYSVRC